MTNQGQPLEADVRPGLVHAGQVIEQESFRIIDSEALNHPQKDNDRVISQV